MIHPDEIQQNFRSSGIRAGLLLNKRQNTLKTLLESFEARLALLPKGDRDILRSMYYESLINVTHSYYLRAEALVATTAICQLSGDEDGDKIAEELKRRVTRIAELCKQCD